MKGFYFEGVNKLKIFCSRVDATKHAVGSLIIIHGMQEHGLRYSDFAQYCADLGLNVFVPDLRGHGKTMVDSEYGYDDGDIFLNIVEDCKILSNFVKNEFPNLPLFVLGHSFGSFISQRLLLQNENIDKIVLSGSTYTKNFLMVMGGFFASIGRFFKGKKAQAKLIENMSLASYGKSFENGNWLSRDESVWEKYVGDELCGKPFPYNFYWSFFRNVLKNYFNLNSSKRVPLLLIGGSLDPVSGKGKGLYKLHKTYQKHGFAANLKMYENARHEVLNETNKCEVYKDVIGFLLAPKTP